MQKMVQSISFFMILAKGLLFPIYKFSCLHFKMSIITANKSLLDFEARTKSQSRHMRNYQKISQSNLDQASIISFLRARNMAKTLSVFISQSNTMKHVNPIIEIFLKGGSSYNGDVREYFEMIMQAIKKNKANDDGQERVTTKISMLECYIYIWYCIDQNELNPSRIGILKEFFQEKGDRLSKIKELLPYFVLPYFSKNCKLDQVNKIFTLEWRNEVLRLMEELIGGQVDTMEQEWLNIISDMIEICEEVIRNIRAEDQSSNLASMIERVKLYKKVVEKNHASQKIAFEEYSIQEEEKTVKMNNLKQTKSVIVKLQESLNKYPQNISKICTIYNKIQLQLGERSLKDKDKPFVAQLIQHDILLIAHKSHHLWKELQWLKLMQAMSSYYISRTYILENKHTISNILEAIFTTYSSSQPSRLTVLYTCFDILQKMVVRRELFELINKNDKMHSVAISLISQHIRNFAQNTQVLILFEVVLLWSRNIVSHRKGRSKFARLHLFQTLLPLLEKFPNNDHAFTVQSLVCSIIYLLLVEPSVRSAAFRLNLKDILIDRMLEKKNQAYDNIVSYILERLQATEPHQELLSDQDVQQEKQYDQNLYQVHQQIILSQSIFDPSISSHKKTNESPVKVARATHSPQKEEYRRQTYNWKKKFQKK